MIPKLVVPLRHVVSCFSSNLKFCPIFLTFGLAINSEIWCQQSTRSSRVIPESIGLFNRGIDIALSLSNARPIQIGTVLKVSMSTDTNSLSRFDSRNLYNI